jgi:flagellar biosynthetic protein FliQ
MSPADVHQMITQTLWTILIASAPVLGIALLVGLSIALFQALTSIQEMTLTFVPKIAAIIVAVIVTIPFIYTTLTGLSDQVFSLIVSGSI